MLDNFQLNNGDGVLRTIVGIFNQEGTTTHGADALSTKVGNLSQIAFDSLGRLYITDYGEHIITRLETNNTLSIIAGTKTAGDGATPDLATKVALDNPYGVAVHSNGDVYISDRDNHVIKKIDATTGIMSIVAGTINSSGNSDNEEVATEAKINFPGMLAINDKKLYFGAINVDRIKVLDLETGMLNSLRDNNGDVIVINKPYGIGLDKYDNIYVSKFEGTADGVYKIDKFGNKSLYTTSFQGAAGISFDKAGNLYVADYDSHRIIKFDANNSTNYEYVAGNNGEGAGTENILATSSKLDNPRSVVVGPDDKIYIGDSQNYSVRSFNLPDKSVTGMPTNSEVGTHSFYIESDSGDTILFNITVNNINDYPTASNVYIDFNFTADDFNFTDIDNGDSFETIKFVTAPNVGSLQLDGVEILAGDIINIEDIGNIVYISDENASSKPSFTFKVNDGEVNSIETYTAILNNKPTIENIENQTIQKNSNTLILPITVTDIDEDNITISIISNDSNLLDVETVSNNIINITPKTDITGTTTVTVTASDGYTNTSKSFEVTVYENKTNINENWEQINKIVASDRDSSDTFGKSVSISGDYVIIGAPWEDESAIGGDNKINAGSAYIFKKDNNGNWNEVQKIVASDRNIYDIFGISVSISGDYAIIGASYEDENAIGGDTKTEAGSAYIFKKDNNGNWTQVQKVVASDRDIRAYFGCSVSINGDYAIIGAKGADSAYIFKNNNGTWEEVQRIVGSDGYFGSSLSISGNYAVIGAYGENDQAGSAYIFKNNNGTWEEVQRIVASDRNSSDEFGNSVSISGYYTVIGAFLEDENAIDGDTKDQAGSAYIFKNNNGTWEEVQKIVASDRDSNDAFGYSVSISGDYTIISAKHEDDNATGGDTKSAAGSAYIFKNNNGTWEEIQKIVASDRYISDYFGHSVAIDGTNTIIGAYSEDDNATGGDYKTATGSAYIFSLQQETDTDGDGIPDEEDIWIDDSRYNLDKYQTEIKEHIFKQI